jgi:diguanylate cyclase (GGDEF)-like protein/PAS domain S-box-containing protein
MASRPRVGGTDDMDAADRERFYLAALLANIPDQIYFKDRDSRFQLVSDACARRLGLERAEEAVGKDDFDFFTPEFARLGFDQEQEMMAGADAVIDVEQEEKHSDGHTAWVSTTKMPLVTPDGETIGIFGLNRDITRRKQAELALLAAHERLNAIVRIQREIAEVELDIRAVHSIIAERTRELAAADGAAILLRDGDELVCRAASGRNVHGGGVRIRPTADGALRRAIDERRSQQLIEPQGLVRAHPNLKPLLGAAVRSLLVVPLEHEGGVIGLLGVFSKSTTPFEQGLAESLELLSLVLSAALSNAAEFEQRRQRIEMLAQFQAIYSRAPIGIATIDSELRLRDPNPALCELLGHPQERLDGQPLTAFVADDDRARERRHLLSLLRGKREFAASEARFIRSGGQVIWAHATVSVVRDADGRPQFAILMIENVTERRLAEEAVREQAAINEYQALHDTLTGLPNRALFHDRVRHALLTAEREGNGVALLMMDLDRFKEVNDTLGHHAGDLLLQELAARLQQTLRATDTIARLGGDEFGLILPGLIDPADVVMLLEKISRALDPPMILGGLPLSIEASIGVAMSPGNGTDPESLLRFADVAMYTAKEQGKDYLFYENAIDASSPVRLMLVSELRQAMEREELVLHYQPKAVLEGERVCGVEALLRWQHPQRGLIPPDEFIPTVQDTGLIKPLTRYVVDHALGQLSAWRDEGLGLSVSVNVAARNLIDAGFPDEVASLLEKWGLEPSVLELEITESAVLGDPLRTKAVLERLHEMGVRLSIDDFGTGYSALVYLKELPLSEIKIDRSFVLNMQESNDDRVIVQATIDLGRNLGLDVVAEGVETRTAWERLKQMGCNLAQGYFFGMPMPPEALLEWLERTHVGGASRRAARARRTA